MNATLLHGLQSKYRALHALRVQDTPDAVPRAQFAALARTFPGALRELDRLPLQLISARLSEIEAVLAGAAEPASWMRLQVAYHGFMRAVLRIRRGLVADASLDFGDPGACLARVGYAPADDEPSLDRFDATTLGMIRRPPRGRLNPWVMEQVARDCAVNASEVEVALFGLEDGPAK